MQPAEIVLKITLRGHSPARLAPGSGRERPDPADTAPNHSGWKHAVVVEKVGPLDPDQRYPSLITGKRACSPEDCGGVPGYFRLLEALADPTDEEHAELTEWVGSEFDPERFDHEAVNAAFAVMARRRRPAGGRSRRRG